jgi:hypothetical protein
MTRTLHDKNAPATSGEPVRVIIWRDIVVVIDDGTAQASTYEGLRTLVKEQAANYSKGLACLTIIPRHATPLPEDVRSALNAALANAPLLCLCWLVEGSGFQGAMARALLTGVRLFGRLSFPTHVATHLDEAVVWMLPHLEGGKARLLQAELVSITIRNQREGGPFLAH